jgi:hypothetical protein
MEMVRLLVSILFSTIPSNLQFAILQMFDLMVLDVPAGTGAISGPAFNLGSLLPMYLILIILEHHYP